MTRHRSYCPDPAGQHHKSGTKSMNTTRPNPTRPLHISNDLQRSLSANYSVAARSTTPPSAHDPHDPWLKPPQINSIVQRKSPYESYAVLCGRIAESSRRLQSKHLQHQLNCCVDRRRNNQRRTPTGSHIFSRIVIKHRRRRDDRATAIPSCFTRAPATPNVIRQRLSLSLSNAE